MEEFASSERKRSIDFEALFESKLLMNLIIDLDGTLLEMNKVASSMMPHMSIGDNFYDYIQQLDQTFVQRLVMESGGPGKETVINTTISGKNRSYYVKMDIKRLLPGESIYIISMLDQSREKSRMERIVHLSLRDQLTGLYNRRYFEEEVVRLDHPDNYPMGVVFADVNGLKMINDTYGHETGDKMLIKASELLKERFESKGLVCRLGGDEFTIVLPRMDKVHLQRQLSQLKRDLSKVIINDVQLSIAMGSVIKEKVGDIQHLLNQAEESMYQSKLFMSANTHRKVLDGIIATLHEKHPREEEHSRRVSELMVAMAEALELSDTEINTFRTAGLLHDIGKIAMDYEILEQPRHLTDDERIVMQKHSEIGYRILNSAGTYHEVVEMVLSHHEKFDGTGYPRGIKGDQLSIGTRALMLCDAYDAMTSERPYKAILSREEAVDEIRKCSGTHFDPEIVEVFVRVLEEAE